MIPRNYKRYTFVLVFLLIFGGVILSAYIQIRKDLLNQSLLESVERLDVNNVRNLLHDGADPNFYMHIHERSLWKFISDIFLSPIRRGQKHIKIDGEPALFLALRPKKDTIIGNHNDYIIDQEDFHKTSLISCMLIEYGADINSKSYRGEYFSFAINCGYRDVVKCLLDHGADPNCRTNDYDWPPLSHAIRRNDLLIAKLLLDYGANPNLHFMPHGETALMQAILEKKEEVVRLLMQYNADVNTRNDQGNSVLFYAKTMGMSPKTLRVIEKGVDEQGQHADAYHHALPAPTGQKSSVPGN